MSLKDVGEFIRKRLTSNLTAKLMALVVAVAVWYCAYSFSYIEWTGKAVPVRVQTTTVEWSVKTVDRPEVTVTLNYPQHFADVKDALDRGLIRVDCNVAAPPTDKDEQTVTVQLLPKFLNSPHSETFRGVRFDPFALQVTLTRAKSATVRVLPITSRDPPGYTKDYPPYPIPATVVISGRRDVVSQLAQTGIETEVIDISTPPPPGVAEWPPAPMAARIASEVLVGGVRYPIHCSDPVVQCRIHLVRKPEEKPFKAIPLGLLEPPNYSLVATLHEQTSDVQVSGPQLIVDALKPENIVLYVDVRDPKLVPQETPYTQPVQAQVVGIVGGNEVVLKPAVATCAVKISEAKPK